MKLAPALFRLLGDDARLRLLRRAGARAAERLGAHRHPRPRAVGRVAPPRACSRRPASSPSSARAASPSTASRPACGRRQRRRTALAAARRRSSRPPRRPRRAGRRCAAARKCGGCARRTSTRTAGLIRASASWSRAAAGRRGRARSGICCRRCGVADLGCGDGYLTIEASRWASRVIAIDRSRPVLERARALAKRRRVSQHHLAAGRARALPLRDASRRRRDAFTGAAPRPGSGARPRRSRPHRRRPAATCSCSTCANTTGVGDRAARRSLARLQRRGAREAAGRRRARAT